MWAQSSHYLMAESIEIPIANRQHWRGLQGILSRKGAPVLESVDLKAIGIQALRFGQAPLKRLQHPIHFGANWADLHLNGEVVEFPFRCRLVTGF